MSRPGSPTAGTASGQEASTGHGVVLAIDPHRPVDYLVPWAAAYAAETGTSVHALLVARNDAEHAALTAASARIARQLVGTGIEHEIETRYGIPGDVVREVGIGADLIVLADASEGAGRSILGVVGQTVISNPPCPVVVVHPGDEVPSSVPDRPIVVGVDSAGTDASVAALSWAVDYATKSDNPVAPLTVARDHEPSSPGLDVPVVDGTPGSELAARSEGAAALVIGTHHDQHPRQPFEVGLGLWCASHAKCPTVIVPASWQPDAGG